MPPNLCQVVRNATNLQGEWITKFEKFGTTIFYLYFCPCFSERAIHAPPEVTPNPNPSKKGQRWDGVLVRLRQMAFYVKYCNKIMEEFELIAKTFMGLEPVLAQELTELGANNVQIGRRMVSFTGNKEMMYRANFQLHTAIRILKPIAHFKAQSAEDMYEEVRKIDWSKYIGEGKTFSVDSVVYSNEFRNSRFVTYKVKDAIVDQFREETGKRPNISVTNPDIRLNIHIAEFDATLSLAVATDRRAWQPRSTRYWQLA